MNTANKLNTQLNTQEEKQYVSQKTRPYKRSFFTHMLFLLLLICRKPIIFIANLPAGGCALMVFLFIYGLLLQYRERIPERTSVAFEMLMIVGGTIFSLLSAYVSWSYDALILRLAPPDYDLILFQ